MAIAEGRARFNHEPTDQDQQTVADVDHQSARLHVRETERRGQNAASQ
jgi:hypothetical protein